MARVVNLMKTIQTQVPQEMQTALWKDIPEDYKESLAEIFK